MTARRNRLALVALAALVYLSLGLASATHWVPTHDEGVTWSQVVGPPAPPRWPAEPLPVSALYESPRAEEPRSAGGRVLDALSEMGGMHPPAYYLLLRAWIGLVGVGALATTAPAWLWGIVTLVGLHRLGRELVPAAGSGTHAMLLLAASPWFVTLSNFARPYSLALCLAVVATNALLRMQPGAEHGRRSRRIARVVFVGASIAGLYTIYHYAFVLAWHLLLLVWLAWRSGIDSRARALREISLIGLAIALGFAPWIPRLVAHLELTGRGVHYFSGGVPAELWLAASGDLATRFALGEAVRTPLSAYLVLAFVALGGVTLPLFVSTYFEPARESRAEDPAVRAFWLSLPLLPGLVILADWWQGTHTIFISKTGFMLLPLAILGIVRSFTVPRIAAVRALRSVALIAWTVLFGIAGIADIHHRATTREPFAAAAAAIARHDEAGHLVVFSSALHGYAIPFALALRDAGVRSARVCLASGPVLARLVAQEIREGRRTAISLVNFDVRYDGPVLGQTWSDRPLARAAQRAREAGWRVVGPARSGELAGDRDASSTLRILGPLATRSIGL